MNKKPVSNQTLSEGRNAAVECLKLLEAIHTAFYLDPKKRPASDLCIAKLYNVLRKSWLPMIRCWPEIIEADRAGVTQDDPTLPSPVRWWCYTKTVFALAVDGTIYQGPVLVAWWEWIPEVPIQALEDLDPQIELVVWTSFGKKMPPAKAITYWQECITEIYQIQASINAGSPSQLPTKPSSLRPQKPLPDDVGELRLLDESLNSYIKVCERELNAHKVNAKKLMHRGRLEPRAQRAINDTMPELYYPHLDNIDAYVDQDVFIPRLKKFIVLSTTFEQNLAELKTKHRLDLDNRIVVDRSWYYENILDVRISLIDANFKMLETYRDLRVQIINRLQNAKPITKAKKTKVKRGRKPDLRKQERDERIRSEYPKWANKNPKGRQSEFIKYAEETLGLDISSSILQKALKNKPK